MRFDKLPEPAGALCSVEMKKTQGNIPLVAPAAATLHNGAGRHAVPGISMESAKGGDDGLMSVLAGVTGRPRGDCNRGHDGPRSPVHLSAQRDFRRSLPARATSGCEPFPSGFFVFDGLERSLGEWEWQRPENGIWENPIKYPDNVGPIPPPDRRCRDFVLVSRQWGDAHPAAARQTAANHSPLQSLAAIWSIYCNCLK